MKKLNLDLSIYSFDIDFAGHVGNNVYLQWAEMGRCKLLAAAGFPIEAVVATGIVPVIANTNITYKKPLYLGNTVSLQMWLSKLEKVIHVIEFRFYNGDGILAATAHQKGVFINSKTLRPSALTDDVRNLFLPYLHDGESVKNDSGNSAN
jgi:acyl-CoA thioester hydrolase